MSRRKYLSTVFTALLSIGLINFSSFVFTESKKRRVNLGRKPSDLGDITEACVPLKSNLGRQPITFVHLVNETKSEANSEE